MSPLDPLPKENEVHGPIIIPQSFLQSIYSESQVESLLTPEGYFPKEQQEIELTSNTFYAQSSGVMTRKKNQQQHDEEEIEEEFLPKNPWFKPLKDKREEAANKEKNLRI
jgi:hypothetical protein